MDRRSFLRRAIAPAPSPVVPPAADALRGSLTPWSPSADAPWDDRRRRHLLRRTGFGAPLAAVEALRDVGAQDAVTQRLDEALSAPLPTPPDWALMDRPARGTAAYTQYTADNREWRRAFEQDYLARCLQPTLRDKLTLLWQNHFVASIYTYDLARHAFHYVQTLRTHALGNFKQFVYDVGLTPAMLIYLDGYSNVAGAPNENYARELMELFTMGIEDQNGTQNYTQEDVRELARALTGWTVDPVTLTAYFDASRHDDGPKTIFGRTDAFDYASALDWIFEARADAIAHFVCARLYRRFIAEPADAAHVAELADAFRASGWEIAPVVETLLRSEAFFDADVIGAEVKDAVTYLIALYREAGVTELPESQLNRLILLLDRLEQPLLQPPNVGGWHRGRGWLTTDSLPRRWNFAGQNLAGITDALQATALALPTPYAPDALAAELARLVLGVPLTPEAEAELGPLLLGGIPAYEWDPADAAVRPRYLALMTHLSGLPEYQLT